jgi:hypothetical protein
MPEKGQFFFRKWKKGSGEYMRERESRNRAKCGKLRPKAVVTAPSVAHNPLLFTHDGF